MPFSVSIGDAIACATLVKNVVRSLKSGAGSSLVYQELLAEFQILDASFFVLERSKLDDIPEVRLTLCETVANCKRNIEQFLSKNQKFASHLRQGGSSSSLKDALRKVQWALFREEDVKDIRLKIQLHLSTVDALLSMYQNAMIYNLAQYTAAQHHQLAAQQSEFLESQRGAHNLLSENHETMSKLHADMQNLSTSTAVLRRRALVSRKRRPGLLGPRVIPRVEFEKAVATVAGRSDVCSTQSISLEETSDRAHSRCEASRLQSSSSHARGDIALSGSTSQHPALQTLASQDQASQNSSSFNVLNHPTRHISTPRRILDKHWKCLGAWLSVITYRESRNHDHREFSDLIRCEKQTVLEIGLLSRMICAQLRFAYGDFQAVNAISVSLSIPRKIPASDEIFNHIEVLPLREFVSFFLEGSYRATDITEEGMSLLSHVVYYRRADIYQFLINEGAKVDASYKSDTFFYFMKWLTSNEPEPCDRILQVMQGEASDMDLYMMGFLILWSHPDYENQLTMLADLFRYDLIIETDVILQGFLAGLYSNFSEDVAKIQRKSGREIFEVLAWFVQRGANLYINSKGVEKGHFPPLATLTYIAYYYNVQGSWLKLLFQYGHCPAKAFTSVLQTFHDRDKLVEQLKHVFYEAFLDLGYEHHAILQIINGNDKVPYERGAAHASSIDFESTIFTRLRSCDSTEAALVRRRRRSYEGD